MLAYLSKEEGCTTHWNCATLPQQMHKAAVYLDRQKISRDTLCEQPYTQTPPLIIAASQSCETTHCEAAFACRRPMFLVTHLIAFLLIAFDDRLVTERVR